MSVFMKYTTSYYKNVTSMGVLFPTSTRYKSVTSMNVLSSIEDHFKG